MVELYSICGKWEVIDDQKSRFLVDSTKGASVSEVDENISFKELIEIVAEDFGVEEKELTLSYVPPSNSEGMLNDSLPIYIRNDRHLKPFLNKLKCDPRGIRLYITIAFDNSGSNIQSKTSLPKENYVLESTQNRIVLHHTSSNIQSNTDSLMFGTQKVCDKLNHNSLQNSRKNISSSSIDYSSRHCPMGNDDTILYGNESYLRVEEHGRSVCSELSSVDTCSTVDRRDHLFSLQPAQDSSPLVTGGSARVTGDIKEKDVFGSKHEMMQTIKKWAIKHKCEFFALYSDKTRVGLKCVDEECSWWFRAIVVKGTHSFVVKKFIRDHTCDTTHRNANHRQASQNLLATMFTGHYSEKKDGLRPRQLMEQVKQDHGVHISYKKAWRSKVLAEDMIRGTPEDSYRNIGGWLYINKQNNPGSQAFLELDDAGKFKYAYFAFGQSLRGFSLMRRVIAIDGTFLKSKFRGTLLAATAQDGDFHLYLLAYAIVDVEDADSWNWFLRCLSASIPDAPDLCFISDRAPSIAKALSQIYPSSYHGICKVHLENNIKVRFRGKGLLALVDQAANAYTEQEFQSYFQQIQKANPKLGEYLLDADVRKWSRCYAPLNRYNLMTTNIAESLNALLRSSREMPVMSLFETIRLTLTTWFHERRTKAGKHKKLVTPNVGKIFVERFEPAMKLDIFPVDQWEFEVKDETRKFVVKLNEMSCTCRVFDIDRIPCIHALAACKKAFIDENRCVGAFHSTEIWAKAYAESIHPAGDVSTWNIPDFVTAYLIAPPATKPSSGRPPTKRHRSTGEYGCPGSKSQPHKCSRCGTHGHNKLTCKTII